MSTVHVDAEKDQGLRAFTKGAPDVLLARCLHELVGEQASVLTEERRAAVRPLQRLRRPVHEPLALGGGRTVGLPARCGGLHAISPECLLDGEPEYRRLVALRRCCQFGAVAARTSKLIVRVQAVRCRGEAPGHALARR